MSATARSHSRSSFPTTVSKVCKTVFIHLRDPKSAWQTALFVAVAALVYFGRASQYLLKPQLYGDDMRWFSDGYNHGLAHVFKPTAGLLHVPERMFGFIVAHLPLYHVPLVYNSAAWVIFMLLAYYLFSARSQILTNNYERWFMLLALCLIANIEEFFFNFSNSVFLIGAVGVLIMFARPARSIVIRRSEKLLFLLSCFTLTFAWIYLIIILLERLRYRRRNNFFLISASLGGLAQFVTFLTSHAKRSAIPLRVLASRNTLLEIYNRILMPALRFARVDLPTFGTPNQSPGYVTALLLLTMATLLVATIIVLIKSSRPVWYLLFFLATMTFASLRSPQLQGDPVRVVQFLSVVGGGGRYYVYGILAVNLVFIKATYLALRRQARYLFMVAFMGFGLASALHYQSFIIQKDYVDYRPQYHYLISQLLSGKARQVSIPINPKDTDNWQVILNSKARP